MSRVKELEGIIKESAVGKAAEHDWFPKGRSLQQFSEIADNRYYSLAQALNDYIEEHQCPCDYCESAWCSQSIDKDGKRYNKGCLDDCEKANEELFCQKRRKNSNR